MVLSHYSIQQLFRALITQDPHSIISYYAWLEQLCKGHAEAAVAASVRKG